MFFCVFFSIFMVNAQTDGEDYARIKIDLTQTAISDIARLGLEADHGEYVRGRYLINDYSAREQQILTEHGVNFEKLINDVELFYANQRNESAHIRSATNCEINANLIHTPINYQSGSMGGYLTYEELLSTLDLMQEKYPHLISAKQEIGNIRTHEDRPIYWLKVGNKPSEEEDEPKVLYTALHHAREATSLSQMVFYLWYLLENYESDADVRFIVDHTSLYFIPCLNPDGYVYNGETNPGGGGLWRKNRRPGKESEIGVDLNRNYGLEWAHDDIGSSGNPASSTYRGPDEFSEPETQAMMQFSMKHNFKIVLNYHSFGNLLIYPWGYNDEPTADDLIFKGFSKSLTKGHNITSGTGLQTVGYPVNGGSDDWLYGEQGSYSFTPEVGEPFYGFWPPQDQIDRINKSVLSQNLQAARLLHDYAEVTRINDRPNEVNFSVLSMAVDTSLINVTVRSLSDDLTFTTTGQTVKLAFNHSSQMGFAYTANEREQSTSVNFELTVETPSYTKVDTFTKILFRDLQILLSDECNDLSKWDTEGWGITGAIYFEGDTSFTDSPDGPYEPATYATLTTKEPIDLSEAVGASLEFHARWEIEEAFDYAQVLLSVDGENFTPLCGKHTTQGSSFQDEGQPVYEGSQTTWVKEEMDLSAYLGKEIWIRFVMASDDVEQLDGLYLDNIRVVKDRRQLNSGTEDIFKESRFQISPNPFSNQFNVISDSKENIDIRVYDELGKLVDRNNLSAGLFFVEILKDGQRQSILKAVKTK